MANLHCQRKITIGGSRKTMNFIVLPYSIKSPYSMEYNATFVSNIPNKINQTIK